MAIENGEKFKKLFLAVFPNLILKFKNAINVLIFWNTILTEAINRYKIKSLLTPYTPQMRMKSDRNKKKGDFFFNIVTGLNVDKKDKSRTPHKLWTLSIMKRIVQHLNYWSISMKKTNNEFLHRSMGDLKSKQNEAVFFNFVVNR